MLKDNFENEILNKIKEDKVEPIPRWHFLLKDYVVWFLGGVALFIGASAFSVVLYLLVNKEWEVYDRISESFLSFLLLTLPYFWIILLALFLLIVNYNLKHTKRGYKYSLPVVAASTVFASIFLGGLFYYAGFGVALDDVLGRRLPFYEKFVNPRMMLWEHPDSGLLSGLVAGRLSDCEFQLFDRMHKEWIINIERTPDACAESLDIGRPIKTLGEMEKGNYFYVEVILPHGPGRGMFHRPGMMPSPEMFEHMEEMMLR